MTVLATNFGVHTRIRVHPVAQGGIDAKMGAKKIDTRKQMPVMIAVRPVRPPSAIPAPLSTKTVTGEHPSRDPNDMQAASVQYASVERGKSPSFSSTLLQKRAIEYRVAVQSMMSTYRKVKTAIANFAPLPPDKSHSWAPRVCWIG